MMNDEHEDASEDAVYRYTAPLIETWFDIPSTPDGIRRETHAIRLATNQKGWAAQVERPQEPSSDSNDGLRVERPQTESEFHTNVGATTAARWRWVLWQDGDVTPDETGVGTTFVKYADHLAHVAAARNTALDEADAAIRSLPHEDYCCAKSCRGHWSVANQGYVKCDGDCNCCMTEPLAAIAALRAEST